MSYKRHQPIDEKYMHKERYHGHHTICQFLRDIYQLTEDEEIRLKCRVAMNMAKSMHNRLKVYKDEYIKKIDMPD